MLKSDPVNRRQQALEIVKLITQLRPDWEIRREHQACVVVKTPTSGIDIWFGHADNTYRSECIDVDGIDAYDYGYIETGLVADESTPQQLAEAIVAGVEKCFDNSPR